MLSLVSLSPLAAQGLEVQPSAKMFEPIVVTHETGTTIQILPWGTVLPKFLDEKNIKRFEDHTVWCAPPGAYLVNGGGDLKIVIIEGNVPTPPEPGPLPPGPNPPPPPPGPGPSPKVPEDRFDNLGRRIDEAAAKANVQVDKRFALAEKFFEVSKKMKSMEYKTIGEASSFLEKAEDSLGVKTGGWVEVRKVYVQDGIKRSPMSWEDATDWYSVVAVGLKGAK